MHYNLTPICPGHNAKRDVTRSNDKQAGISGTQLIFCFRGARGPLSPRTCFMGCLDKDFLAECWHANKVWQCSKTKYPTYVVIQDNEYKDKQMSIILYNFMKQDNKGNISISMHKQKRNDSLAVHFKLTFGDNLEKKIGCTTAKTWLE